MRSTANRTLCERPIQASVFLLCAICYASKISIATGAHGILSNFPRLDSETSGKTTHFSLTSIVFVVFVVVRVMRVCV